MTQSAVELTVPDQEGARAGTNLFHLWADACKHGVGAGLFQAPATSVQTDDFYSVLGVTSWCTKTELDHRLGRFKREVKQTAKGEQEWLRMQEAYDVLSNKESRSAYDTELGLAGERKARVNLVPLGFVSKSLSKAQQNRPTWERELLAILEALVHFRSIVGGAEVVLHTDHINNTTLAETSSQSDKLLRMISKIESMINPRWMFSLGML